MLNFDSIADWTQSQKRDTFPQSIAICLDAISLGVPQCWQVNLQIGILASLFSLG